jgi:hypothetical protein
MGAMHAGGRASGETAFVSAGRRIALLLVALAATSLPLGAVAQQTCVQYQL